MIRKLESQRVARKTHSLFNSPIWPVRKCEREWRLTVDYLTLDKVTPPLSTAVPDMLKLQYELESKAAKRSQAHNASGHQGRDATQKWTGDPGVDLTMDNISQVIHNCETCAVTKQAKWVKTLCQETALSGHGASGVRDPSGQPPGIFWEEGSCGPADYPGKDQNLLELRTKDLKDAFFCLPLHEASQKIFAFEWENPKTVRKNQLTWCVLPQGYKNSPTIFGEQLAKDLESWEPPPGEGQLLQYVDDLLIATRIQETCVDWTVSLLNFLGLQGYRVSQKKAQMVRQTVIYLGYEKAEIITLTRALELPKGKEINIYTDSRYAFGVVHAHGAIWKERGLLNSQGKNIKHAQEILRLLDAVQLPEKVAIMHIKAHQKVSSELEEGNMLADREAKDAAKGEVPDETVEAALIPDGKILIEEIATVERPTHKLKWLDNKPRWVAQWPLSKEKLKALEELVEEQVAQGHLEETTSPWNFPVFVIKKPGKDRWRLLHDLREINKIIEDMGPLQPGMPSPTMLPRDWQLAVLDIKDCFFQIPLHPEDAPRFAFSVPTINREAPMKRYHWKVLPQGLKSSPFICQQYVASLLSPVRAKRKDAIILHYMDDLLVCAPNDSILQHTLDLVVKVLTSAGFQLQEDKVQRMPPWKYLGLQIAAKTIVPQKLEIECNPKTLADLHSLCGSLNWVRPWLGLTNEDLDPLFNLLKGERELVSPRVLTPEAKTAIEKVQKALSERQAHRCEPNIPFQFIVLGKLPHLHGLIFQWIEGQRDSLLIIEWVFLSHQRSKTITEPQELIAQLIRKARVRLCELAGCDFTCIHLPVKLSKEGRNSPKRLTKEMFEHLLQSNASLQLSLDSYRGQISVHAPSHKLLNEEFHLIPREKRSRRPLKALTVFTDASGASHKSVMTWRNPQTQRWEADVEFVEGSPQVAELAAVVRAFEKFSEPINLVTDSAYVAGVVSRAEPAVLKEIDNEHLFRLLSKLIYLISHREHPFYVMHVRSHTDLPGKAESPTIPSECARPDPSVPANTEPGSSHCGHLSQLPGPSDAIDGESLPHTQPCDEPHTSCHLVVAEQSGNCMDHPSAMSKCLGDPGTDTSAGKHMFVHCINRESYVHLSGIMDTMEKIVIVVDIVIVTGVNAIPRRYNITGIYWCQGKAYDPHSRKALNEVLKTKIEGCAIKGYDLDFNITQVCTEYHEDKARTTPIMPKKAVLTQRPVIPEVEEKPIVPIVTRIGPYAIKKMGIQRLLVNPEWSLKQVEMGVQVNASDIRPECAPFLRHSFMDWTIWLQKRMPSNFRSKRDFTGLLGTGLGRLNVGEDEARKPYKYDCLDSENMKPISEIELKASFDV
ncbi:hypothetical protein DUI87_01326 [Hirundo rustica rustica]|uniref:ribonuclease H n=1 Tax=Hirundo rustica rustica TaxID=333673 RepID=A0A3M0L680_HIRRU|nr:hypothetical protein DUI87_01326 [Hirundo rustica rustica]